jgi:hypothetical protein
MVVAWASASQDQENIAWPRPTNEWHLWRSKKPKRFRFDVGFEVRGGKANLRVAML